ncbi:MAG: flavin reductase family protein [Clostridiaceae bacterium]|nr:flavin reductase family protein [Clostridiaceae bacterium]
MNGQHDIKLDPAALLAPVPVAMISCRDDREDAVPNIITLAWIGVASSEPPTLSAAIRPDRYSYELIRRSGEFVVNLVDANLSESCDFCGVRSGREIDKFKACGLHAIPAEGLQFAPAIAESPLSLGCQVTQVVQVGSHDLFLGRVVSVRAHASLMDDAGRLRMDLAQLITYVHGEYFSVGKRQGFFGYSVARSKVLAKRMPGYRRQRTFE